MLKNIPPQYDNEPLMSATIIGDLEKVKSPLETGADPNRVIPIGMEGVTALLIAEKTGQKDIAALLLKAIIAAPLAEVSADCIPNMSSKDYWNNHLISRAGADLVQVANVHLLLRRGADPNSTTSGGKTALMAAAEMGHVEVVELLLKNGADPNRSQDAYIGGETALIMAASKGHVAVADLLLKNGVDPNYRVKSRTQTNGRTVLMTAVENGHVAFIKFLLENGVNPNTDVNLYGDTALTIAARNGHVAVTEFLLENGADPNKGKSVDELPPLQTAVNRHHNTVAKLLLKYGAHDLCNPARLATELNSLSLGDNGGSMSQVDLQGITPQLAQLTLKK